MKKKNEPIRARKAFFYVFCKIESLGRVDIHFERPIWPDCPRLYVAFLARCVASRLEKRLDP